MSLERCFNLIQISILLVQWLSKLYSGEWVVVCYLETRNKIICSDKNLEQKLNKFILLLMQRTYLVTFM